MVKATIVRTDTYVDLERRTNQSINRWMEKGSATTTTTAATYASDINARILQKDRPNT